MRRLSLRAQRGDTIVEVLVTIVVISVVLVGAFVTTNRNIANVQDAQERSQALKIVEGQVEFMRNAAIKATPIDVGGCFDYLSGTPQNGSGTTCQISPNGAGTEPTYTITIALVNPTPATYNVKAVWDSLIGLGQNNVNVFYRPPTP